MFSHLLHEAAVLYGQQNCSDSLQLITRLGRCLDTGLHLGSYHYLWSIYKVRAPGSMQRTGQSNGMLHLKSETNDTIQITRWSLVATFDSLFEIAIFLLSIVLVVPLQMTREIKLSVVFAFSFRLM